MSEKMFVNITYNYANHFLSFQNNISFNIGVVRLTFNFHQFSLTFINLRHAISTYIKQHQKSNQNVQIITSTDISFHKYQNLLLYDI